MVVFIQFEKRGQLHLIYTYVFLVMQKVVLMPVTVTTTEIFYYKWLKIYTFYFENILF